MLGALRCEHCGASLPAATPEVASLLCGSCGGVTRVEGALLEALHTHERAVGDTRRRGAGAGLAALESKVAASFGRGWAVGIVLSWLLAALVAMPETALAYALALSISSAPLVLAFVTARRRLHRFAREREAQRVAQERVPLRCPGCGGQTALEVDRPVHPCGYCGGALAADPEALQAMVGVARASASDEERRAREERWRLAATRNRDPRTDLLPFMVFGSLVAILVSAALFSTLAPLVSGAPAQLRGASLLLLDLLALGALAALLVPLLRRRRELRRYFAVLDAVAAHAGAGPRGGLEALASWLVTHWRGEFRGRWIGAGRGYACFSGDSGIPWALSVAPEAQASGPVEVHVRVIVPGAAQGTQLQALAADFEALGLQCWRGEGGLVATLPTAQLEAALEQPARLAPILALLHNAKGRPPAKPRVTAGGSG